MIAYGVKWPSITEDSEILRQRIAAKLYVVRLRERLDAMFERRAA
jgi:hypothetical protein